MNAVNNNDLNRELTDAQLAHVAGGWSVPVWGTDNGGGNSTGQYATAFRASRRL
jgi:hypothetical protein